MPIRDLSVAELNPALNVTLVSDATGLERVANFFSRVSVFGFDTETNVVPRFTTRKLRTIQVGDRNEQYVIDLLPFAGSSQALSDGQGGKTAYPWARPIIDTLRLGLDSKTHLKVGANLQFDYETVLWCLGIRSWGFYDVQLAEKVIYAGRVPFFTKGFYALDDLVERYCLMRISKSEQKGFDLETPLTQSQIEYAALDTRLPLAVMAGQRAVIEKAQLARTVRVENYAIPAFGELHINGLLLDKTLWNELGEENLATHAANVKALDKYFLPVVGSKVAPKHDLLALEAEWKNTPKADKAARVEARKAYQVAAREVKKWDKDVLTFEGDAAINYSSPDQILAALHKIGGFNKTNLKSTNDKVLAKFSDKPVVIAIQDYRETKQITKGFGESWYEHIDEVTGRIHSSINQMGAETGRTSSSKPNVQNIKKEKKWRRCFRARPGKKIITTDMSGAELRIMADDSDSEMWITAFENDWDLHSIGAAEAEPAKWESATLRGCAFTADKQKCKCPVHAKLRDDNKSTNFGIGYGMEGPALAAKLHISKDDADKKLANWRKANREVSDYLAASGEKAKLNCCAHDMIGRRRLFHKPDWKRATEIALKREEEDAKDQGRPQRPVTQTMVGRVYYSMFGSIEREGKNMRIQGTNASIAKIAMGAGFDDDGKPFMWHLLPQYDAELQNFVHDEFDVEAPEDKAEECAAMIRDCILRAGAMVMKRVKMLSESHIEDYWTK
jgi:DNA polymerase I-like protein with 3'-5' exonuclease and polymerase domains